MPLRPFDPPRRTQGKLATSGQRPATREERSFVYSPRQAPFGPLPDKRRRDANYAQVLRFAPVPSTPLGVYASLRQGGIGMTGGISSPHFQSSVLKKVEFRTEPGTGKSGFGPDSIHRDTGLQKSENACATENLHIGPFSHSHGSWVKLDLEGKRLQFAAELDSPFVSRDDWLSRRSCPGEEEDGSRYLLAVWRAPPATGQAFQLDLIGQDLLLGLFGAKKDLGLQCLRIFAGERGKI